MKLFNMRDLVSLTGLSKATIYVLIKEGLFPRPKKVGKRSVRWLEKEIEEWIVSRPRTAA